MPSDPDFLERLWSGVINVDPEGKWIEASIRLCKSLPKYASCANALERLKKAANLQDVGRVSRHVRFESCSVAVYSFDDPGLPKASLADVLKGFKTLASGEKPENSVAKYISSFDLSIDEEKADWLLDLAKKKQNDGPFGDTGPALARLLKAGATAEDISQLARWSEFESVFKTHEILQTSRRDEDELEGMHELLLGAEPSGLEAGSGSWPLAEKSAKAGKIEPLWKIRSGQAIAFSSDSERVAIAGASGPARIFESKSGKELAVCEGIKLHIPHLAFSPDGARLAVAQMYHQIAVCNAKTGKLLAKNFFPKPGGDLYGPEISGLEFAHDDKIIRSSWKQTIDIADAKTYKPIEPLRPAASTRSVDAIAFFPNQKKFAAIWEPRRSHSDDAKRVNIWSWPEREVLLRFGFKGGLLNAIAISRDGKYIATTYDRYDLKAEKSLHGVYLFDATNGELLREWKGPEGKSLSFAPKDILFAADRSRVWIIDIHSDEKPKIIQVGSANSSLIELQVSPCGRFLGTVGSSGGAIWDLPALVKK